MIWPPVKAWTSKLKVNGQAHFVAINYGGKLPYRWVILMSVIDSSVLVKVSWSELVNSSIWEPGWNDMDYLESSKLVNTKSNEKKTIFSFLSFDSGLTIPITKRTIRPWFEKN